MSPVRTARSEVHPLTIYVARFLVLVRVERQTLPWVDDFGNVRIQDKKPSHLKGQYHERSTKFLRKRC